ncbi:MAG: hypothetical protein JSS76_08370 [Bacteroidetes bacterium]|nr:hypothetical protein [Bacteroidota bacterium]
MGDLVKRTLQPAVAAKYTTTLNPESAHILPGLGGRRYLDQISIADIEKLHEANKCKDIFHPVEPAEKAAAAKTTGK